MVMVANKKTSQQMADDLSLFLGNNTIKFTAWLHGVLEKLRSVAVEPASLRHQLHSDSSNVAGKSRLSVSEDGRTEEAKVLTVSSSGADRTEARVSSSAHDSRCLISSRLTSTVKPLMELLPSEAVIDIKPEMDDDLIAEEPVEMGTNHRRTRGTASRPTTEIYRMSQSKFTSVGSVDTVRAIEGSSHTRQQDSRSSRASRTSSNKIHNNKVVVRVNRAADEDSDDVEEEDSNYGGRGLSSRVSLPSKPERKPTLPPAKQANRNLILKAISEAQDSITKTTAYTAMPQRQTVPVAPRTRLASSEEMTAAIQLVQEHLHSLAPRKIEINYKRNKVWPSCIVLSLAPARSLASRLQLDLAEIDMADEDIVPLKKQKVMERCKFWPVCKSGDECMYHHPTTQCKTFPNCKFGDKCLFVHPNCKYDARCTKPDCPFTHVSRRGTAAPPPNVCRFFPECKKVDCLFYHPKPCRFAAQCKRAGCTFYHPTTSVPPRHALKWTKAQSR
uniref:Zinc finger CCCH domain-containing protein 14 n=1 Tax=Monopterus albus TaxID=43700 RepID=A0A3Q3II22_MONAL